MYFRSINDMNQTILRGLEMIPQEVDLVVGVPRSGMLAANMVALYLNRPLTDLEGLLQGRVLGKGKRVVKNFDGDIIKDARKILIVDDCVSKGTEIKRAKQKIEDGGFADRAIFATVYSFPENPHLADIVMEMIPRPMCFQWSCMYTPELSHCCVDIDGILCHDCPKEQDDDGAGYEDFLENAPPLFVPTHEVGWLVTSRLEKYRGHTERWLAKHDVSYEHLVMMDVPNMAERSKRGAVWQYKADAYKEAGALLFIESCPKASYEIQKLTDKPVLCPINATMYGAAGNDQRAVYMQQRGWDKKLRRIKRIPSKIAREVMAVTGRGAKPGSTSS